MAEARQAPEPDGLKGSALDEPSDGALRDPQVGGDLPARQQPPVRAIPFLFMPEHADYGAAGQAHDFRTFRDDAAGNRDGAPRLTGIRNVHRGKGLDGVGLGALRAAVVLNRLVDALIIEDAFWHHVAAACDSRTALHLAGGYGSGRSRRAIIARLLFIAHTAGDEDLARFCLRVGCATSSWEPAETTGRDRYALRDDFFARTSAGTTAIAHRGARRCLACGTRLAGQAISMSGVRVRREYCDVHSRDSLNSWRREAMDHVFKEASAFRPVGSWELPLIGERAAGVAHIFEAVEDHPELESRWLLKTRARWGGP